MKSLPMTKKRQPLPDNVLVMVPMGITERMLYIPKEAKEDEQTFTAHIREIIRDFLRGPRAHFVHEVAVFGKDSIVSYFDDYDEAVWELIWEVLQEPEFSKPPRGRRKSTSSKRRKR